MKVRHCGISSKKTNDYAPNGYESTGAAGRRLHINPTLIVQMATLHRIPVWKLCGYIFVPVTLNITKRNRPNEHAPRCKTFLGKDRNIHKGWHCKRHMCGCVCHTRTSSFSRFKYTLESA